MAKTKGRCISYGECAVMYHNLTYVSNFVTNQDSHAFTRVTILQLFLFHKTSSDKHIVDGNGALVGELDVC